MTRAEEFVDQYCEAAKFFGEPLNGLRKAELKAIFIKADEAGLLELLDTIYRHKEMKELQKEQQEALKEAFKADPNPPLRTWTTDSTHYNPPLNGNQFNTVQVIGISTPNGTTGDKAPSPYKHEITGGLKNE